MGKDDEVTIGYWYSFGIHMGLGRGPIDELVEIRVADQTAWTGSVTSSASFSINKPELFGGEKGEGGIDGTFTLQMGGPTQGVLASLASMLGGVVPAFRGVVTAFFDGKVCALNPYPKIWTFRVRRALQGWDTSVWYSSKAVIALEGGAIKAMNPAHILYECLTNPLWGRGLSADQLDLTKWTAVADTLYNEGFGLCFRWVRQGSINDFIQTVLDHIGGVVDVDRRTGLLTLTLIRDDYNVATLPHFDYSNGLLAVEDLEVSALDTSTNSVTVNFMDPIKNEQRSCPPVQNLAGVQTSGAINGTTQDYFALPTETLASRVALRDLIASLGILKRVKLHLNHVAWEMTPGKVIKISVPTLGIDNMVLRIGRMELGAIDGAQITLTAIEDVFGMPETSYVEPQPSQWVPPDRIPRDISTVLAIESSYADLCRYLPAGDIAALNSAACYWQVTGVKPVGLAMNFHAWAAANTSADGSKRDVAGGYWAATGLTSAIIPQGASAVVVTLTSPFELDKVRTNTVARINDEDFRVDAINLGTNQVTLARGCSDTVPVEHALGSRVWFYHNYTAHDLTKRATGDTIYYKLLTKTSAGSLTLASATARSLAMTGRQWKPYPPGNIRLNGAAYPATVGIDPVITMSHRDRITQANNLYDTTAGNQGPEASVTYRVRLYSGAALKRTAALPAGTATYTYTLANEVADGGPFNPLRIVIDAERGGIYSRLAHDITVGRTGLATAPPIVEEVTPSVFATDTTAHLVAMPAVVNTGDRLLMGFCVDGNPTITLPAGWTLINEQHSGAQVRIMWLWKDAIGTEDGTTVDMVTSVVENAVAQVWRIRVGTFDAAVAPAAGVPFASASTQPNPPALATGWGAVDTLWIASYGADDDDDPTAYPYPYNNTYTKSAATTTSCSMAACALALNSPNLDPGIFTIAATEEWVANTIAIKPAP